MYSYADARGLVKFAFQVSSKLGNRFGKDQEIGRLAADSTCADEHRTRYDPTQPTEIKFCKLYTLISVYNVQVEVQLCRHCPLEKRRYVGPDLRAWGIFNYNNSILVSHELLDEYTSEFTSSETPFTAFVLRIARRYKRGGVRFMGEDLLRSVWFAYVYLQRLTDDMTCKSCGPSPSTVIFDGVTLGSQQLLPDALLRRKVRAALEGPDFGPLLEDLEDRRRHAPATPAQAQTTPDTPSANDLLSTPSVSRTTQLFPDTPSANDLFSTPSIARSFDKFVIPPSPSPSSAWSPSTPCRTTSNVHTPSFGTPIPQPNFGVSPPGQTSGTSVDTIALATTGSSMPSTTSPSKDITSPSKRGLTDDEAKARKRLLVREHLSLVEWVRLELKKQGGADCPHLAVLFDTYFGQLAYAGKAIPKRTLKVWKNLFLQLAAEESVVQMVNHQSWVDLTEYLKNPTASNSSKLVSIPAFHKALSCKGCDVDALNSVMRWVEKKARAVLLHLISQASPPLPLAEPNTLPTDNDWRKTGSFYSLPIIRHRPKYPRLDDGEKKDNSGPRGDRCGKYYSEYKEKRLTGGIMVCWCHHSVCYGFHTIPESEGRNDVFSAMVTRWPTAPQRVVYDFACALGPYCMTREPQFFANTYFMIDHFHAAGHTKCSPAAFLSEYENTDPQLSSVNSSAAECGNGALRKIRKSVSYMSQERAIIYTKVFLSIWNRTRALKAGGKAKKARAKGKGKGRGKGRKTMGDNH
ncbi:hypothetical protein NMY22_g19388 [Coprinellus aureogranulatus]|nr:hypothetical protein NMY22_g19388 [Coprinellus aureogranulatus]